MLRFSPKTNDEARLVSNQLKVGDKLIPINAPLLSLHAWNLSNTFVLTLCKEIGKVGKVRKLELNDNELDDTVIPGLIENLILNPNMRLQRLDLGGNKITDQGVLLLKRAITQHPSLTTLILDGNPGISKSFLTEIATITQDNARRMNGTTRNPTTSLKRLRAF